MKTLLSILRELDRMDARDGPARDASAGDALAAETARLPDERLPDRVFRAACEDVLSEGPRRTLISLFSGAGGLDIGLEQAGFTTLLATELEAHACDTLRMNKALRTVGRDALDDWISREILSQRCYRNASQADAAAQRRRLLSGCDQHERFLACAEIVQADVRSLSANKILEAADIERGALDLLAGGPPCQPFSRAGKREMTDCDDGQLFMEFVRLVDGIRPRFFLFENVKGLVIHKADVARMVCRACGAASIPPFARRAALKNADECNEICSACGAERTHDVVWTKERAGTLEVIEAEFARLGYRCSSRVLNAADFGAPQHRERLFIIGSRDGEDVPWPIATHGEIDDEAQTVLPFERPGTRRPWLTVHDALYRSGHFQYGSLGDQARLWVKNVVRPHDEPVTWSLHRPAPTIGAHQAAKLAIAPHGVPEAQLARQQWHVLGRRQGDTPPVPVEHEYLSDEELLALQTFPKGWYLHGTRMQRAFQIGNAVPPVLARAVGQELIGAMAASDLSDDIAMSMA